MDHIAESKMATLIGASATHLSGLLDGNALLPCAIILRASPWEAHELQCSRQPLERLHPRQRLATERERLTRDGDARRPQRPASSPGKKSVEENDEENDEE